MPAADAKDWLFLAKKTRWVPLLFTAPVVKVEPGSVQLRAGTARYINAAVAAILGFGLLVLTWIKGGEFFFRAFFIPFCIACGTFLVWTAYRTIFNRNRVEWSPSGNSVNLACGSGLLVRRFEILKAEIGARMYARNSTARAQGTDETVLALIRHEYPNTEVIIARLRDSASVRALFDELNKFLNGNGQDETLATVVLPNGTIMAVPKTPISKSHASFATMGLVFPDANTAVFKPLAAFYLFCSAFVFLGLTPLVFLLLITTKERNLLGILLTGLVGEILAVSGGSALLGEFATRTIVADRLRGSLRIYPTLRRYGPRMRVWPLNEIAAIQVCSTYNVGSSDSTPYTSYEINLVFTDPRARRIPILSHAKEAKVREEARLFAEFLGKPLLDHT